MSNRIPEIATDEELLRSMQRGSEEAFVVLYRRHHRVLFRFAMHMTGSRETAEEIAQDVFLSLLRSAGQFDARRGSLEAYLIGSVRNQVRTRLREAARHSAAESQEVAVLPVVELEHDLAKLREAILSLPVNYREVVVMCDMEEIDYDEAARRIGCPVGTVRSRLHRARAILLARMKVRRGAACS